MRDFTKYIDSLFKCLENLTFCVGVDISYENNMNVITLTYNYDDNEFAYNLIDLFKPKNIECVHKILSPLPKECYTIKTVEKNKPKPKGLDYYVENSGIDIDNITGYSILKPIYGNDFIDIDNITPAVFVS
jgi:hypothetical protein